MIPRLVLAVAIALAPEATAAKELNFGRITCGQFLASGPRNMAALISWLRGYHSGKTGLIPFQAPDPYGRLLGAYCARHAGTNLIEASERILADLEHGI